MMNFNSEKLQSQINGLSPRHQAFFALLCAERLRACCWAFSKREDWELSIYYETCEMLFMHLSQNTKLDQSQAERIISQIDECVPQADEFGDPLSVQAQSGLVALLYTIDAWKTGDPDPVVRAAGTVEEALDNYEYFVHKTLTGKATSPSEFPLLDREIQWQFECISFLKEITESSQDRYVSLRIMNRSYTVPVAV